MVVHLNLEPQIICGSFLLWSIILILCMKEDIKQSLVLNYCYEHHRCYSICGFLA
nr:MAG TPA: hypothetical protein [Caudoviricetes sp.]